MPFPSEETTPPVMKTYRVMGRQYTKPTRPGGSPSGGFHALAKRSVGGNGRPARLRGLRRQRRQVGARPRGRRRPTRDGRSAGIRRGGGDDGSARSASPP